VNVESHQQFVTPRISVLGQSLLAVVSTTSYVYALQDALVGALKLAGWGAQSLCLQQTAVKTMTAADFSVCRPSFDAFSGHRRTIDIHRALKEKICPMQIASHAACHVM
jgi:hypothetical protein